ncbi:family 10 glycosylhydrolase [Paenibacillus sp. 1P07SE]|uniref:family 10 glycosylhydrolase n=1 Tax=Paenibacillus sp. 1P07SE TaxID=3132209 RepID=UPI0039A466A1
MNLPYRKLYGMTAFVLIIVLLCTTLAGAAGLPPGGESEDAEDDPTLNIVQQQEGEYELATVDSSLAAADQPAAPFVIVEDFEAGGVTASAVRASVQLAMASRPEPVLYGNHSARLSYQFVGGESGTAAAYVNLWEPDNATYRLLPGKPAKIGMWVHGDGNNKHWLRAEFAAMNGTTPIASAIADLTTSTGFNWTGWRYIVADLPAVLREADVTDIKLRRIYMTQTNNDNKTDGVVYLDRVSVFYGDTGGLYGLDLHGLAPMKTGETLQASVYETRQHATAPQRFESGTVYASEDAAVATVDPAGSVHALAPGTTRITAQAGGFEASYMLTVSDSDPVVDELSLTGPAELRAGDQAQTTLIAQMAGTGERVQITQGAAYSSSDEMVAVIDEEGVIHARGEGTAILQAEYRGRTATLEIGVGVQIPVLERIVLSGLGPLEIGQEGQALITAIYNTGEEELTEGVTFTSSQPAVAAVSEGGKVQALSMGITRITAAFEGKSVSFTVVVNKAGIAQPKHELRAAWIASVEQIDWPKTYDPEQQRRDFSALLDFHQSMGMNAVVVQIKPTADAFYRSELAPWSHWLTGEQGKDPGYDPLAFMIEEAHKRNLEFHAWLNPYRISMHTDLNRLTEDHPARLNPDWVMNYSGRLYFDPGHPDVIDYITKSVDEVVANYDVDAIHFDDYFYPNRYDGTGYPDQQTYERFGEGYTDINAWRRHNVDTLIEGLNASIKAEKPYVKFGISPFGVWRNKSADPLGSDTTAGQPSYDNLHADIRKWVLEGWIDYVAPQVYWNFGFSPAAYEVLVKWWDDLIAEHDADVHLYIGHAAYKVDDNENFTDPYEIVNQMRYNLNFEHVHGSIQFTTRDLLAKTHLQQILREYQQQPALVPAMPWLGGGAPAAPVQLSGSYRNSSMELRWTDADEQTAYYVIYRAEGETAPSVADPSQIHAMVRKGADSASYMDNEVVSGRTYTYLVTAVDRLHHESDASRPLTVAAAVQNPNPPVYYPPLVPGPGGEPEQPEGVLQLAAGAAGIVRLGTAITLEVPAGATDRQTRLAIERLMPAEVPEMAGYRLASEVYEITSSAVDPFLRPAAVTVSFDETLTAADRTPTLYALAADRTWQPLAGMVADGLIRAEIDGPAVLAVFVEAASSPPPAPACPAETLSDLTGHWAASQIVQAAEQCLTSGYPDQTFRPNAPVSRAEFAQLLVRALGLEGPGAELSFADQQAIRPWARDAVALATEAGIVNGFEDGTFRPDALITRAEMTTMLGRALQLPTGAEATPFADDQDIPAWAKDAVAAAAAEGLIQGRSGGRFEPQGSTTRAEAVVVLLRMTERS